MSAQVFAGYEAVDLDLYGQDPGSALRTLAGGATSEIARVLVADPTFQAALASTADRAEEAAYRGVQTWMRRNWPWLLVGGFGLIVGNYVTLLAAIAQRDVRFKRRGVL